ncbi:hypothetical protein CBOM_01878 [Ceraceosorus bombacis]|uniref:Uncharacterized protein n=1 Tax=Ceraceosorus bombacis TaxID=401625 RepID=A0A0P1BD94_9BASI|nr:hypothetical protein CBOM_01878 [Ceraceosorus bombacis]
MVWLIEGCFDGDGTKPFSKLIKPNAKYTFGRKEPADIVIKSKLISQEGGYLKTGPFTIDDVADVHSRPSIEITAGKKGVRIVPAKEVHKWEANLDGYVGIIINVGGKRSLEDGDLIIFASKLPLSLRWASFAFSIPRDGKIEPEWVPMCAATGIHLAAGKNILPGCNFYMIEKAGLTLNVLTALATAMSIVTSSFLQRFLGTASLPRLDEESLEREFNELDPYDFQPPLGDDLIQPDALGDDADHSTVLVADHRRPHLLQGVSLLFVRTGTGETPHQSLLAERVGARTSVIEPDTPEFSSDRALTRFISDHAQTAQTHLEAVKSQSTWITHESGLVILVEGTAAVGDTEWFLRLRRVALSLRIAMPLDGATRVNATQGKAAVSHAGAEATAPAQSTEHLAIAAPSSRLKRRAATARTSDVWDMAFGGSKGAPMGASVGAADSGGSFANGSLAANTQGELKTSDAQSFFIREKSGKAGIAPGQKPDRDEVFLQALSTGSRTKFDKFDEEFNKLRIARPQYAGGSLATTHFVNQEEADDQMFEAFKLARAEELDDLFSVSHGNFVAVDFVPLIKRREQRPASTAFDGRPNFKKFKQAERPKRVPIALEHASGPGEMFGDPAVRNASATRSHDTTQDLAVTATPEAGMFAATTGASARPRTKKKSLFADPSESEEEEEAKPIGSRRHAAASSRPKQVSDVPSRGRRNKALAALYEDVEDLEDIDESPGADEDAASPEPDLRLDDDWELDGADGSNASMRPQGGLASSRSAAPSKSHHRRGGDDSDGDSVTFGGFKRTRRAPSSTAPSKRARR